MSQSPAWNLTYMILTGLVVLVALYSDLRWRRVFNFITLPVMLTGLVLHTVDGGLAGLVFSLKGLGVGLGMLVFIAFLGKAMGGGDLKLFMAIGTLQGPGMLLWIICYSALAGGIIALLIAIIKGIAKESVRNVFFSIYERFALQTPMDMAQGNPKAKFPYVIAIFFGVLITSIIHQPWLVPNTG